MVISKRRNVFFIEFIFGKTKVIYLMVEVQIKNC